MFRFNSPPYLIIRIHFIMPIQISRRTKQLNCKNFLIIICIFIAGCFTKLQAQNPAINDVNNQLRRLFSPLSRPTPSWWFLYEMSAHSTDSSWFTRFCPNTNETDVWYKVYEEMYHSAYDTAPLPTVQTIMDAAQNYTNDIIPIGIMNYSYYTLKPEAMSTDLYFNFDLVNDILTDKDPRPGFPYLSDKDHAIFMSAPLLANTHSANPTYLVSPDFVYKDDFNASLFSDFNILKIDFGDGAGWIDFNPTLETYHQVTYHDAEPTIHIIKVKLTDRGGEKIFGSSQSNIWVNNTINAIPDGTMDVPGLNVSVFNNCNGNPAKTVIYLEGIDPLDFKPSWNRTATDIYTNVIQSDQLVELKNQGYRFVVVDWKNSRVDMRFNALYLVNLIQELKNTAPNDEPFIIMGESMGGVIARYALTYMESKQFASQDNSPFFIEAADPQNAEYISTHPSIRDLPNSWNHLERMHNTRLFISIDAPHQGANVPISIQKLYKYVIGQIGPFIGTGFTSITSAFNLFLESKAAKQLLIYHVETEFGFDYKQYGNHPDRITFMAQLAEMGNYPKFAKIMLMSNGSLQGVNQLNYYTNVLRTANDRLLDFKLETYARIFGIKIPLFGVGLGLRTNPDGNGKVLNANAGLYRVRIRLRWFGIRISIGYNSMLDRVDYAHTRPYCTSAGGIFATDKPLVGYGSHVSPNPWLFNLIPSTTTNDGHGCVLFDTHLGWNGFLTAHLDYSLCTDGFQFGFVPVQSALDYGKGDLPLNFNIERDHDINTKLNNIPKEVDVIVGIPGAFDDLNPRNPLNRSHVGFRNDDIRNLTNAVPPFPNFENTYFSCIDHDARVRRGFLNLEIGDEELYLENNNLTYNAEYKIEYDLHVNERNPHYEYISQPFGTNPGMLLGVYSRQNDFAIIAPNGFANFIFDATHTPTGIGFAGIVLGSFVLTDEPLENCCVNYMGRGKRNSFTEPKPAGFTASYLKLFPNPNAGGRLTLQYQFKKEGKVNLNIINIQGQKIWATPLFIPANAKEVNTAIDLKNLHLAPGMYIIKLTNGAETLTGKIVVAK